MAFSCLALGLALALQSTPDPDTVSPDATIKALYAVISGPAGQKRDWARFHKLFAPGARMVAAVKQGEKVVMVAMTPKDYEARSGPFLEREGFEEVEIGRREERYGAVVHAFSAYEGKVGGKLFDRGVNSIQLMSDGARWWLQSVVWCGERDFGALPAGLVSDGA